MPKVVNPPLNCHHVRCRELGKVLTGKLVIVTPDSEHTFIVKGRQPAYVPPSPSALPSSKFLTAGTASSMAHSRSNSPVMRGSTSSSSGTAAAAAQRTGGGTQQGTAGVSSKNYLQQNIKAARSGAGGKSSGVNGQGASRQWA
jgi:hypothetical protein